MEIPGFLGKTGMFFQEKPGKPGEGSGLSRKAWILSIQTEPRKARKGRNDCAGCEHSRLSWKSRTC